MPRVWELVAHDIQHPVMAPVAAWYARHLPRRPTRRPLPEGPNRRIDFAQSPDFNVPRTAHGHGGRLRHAAAPLHRQRCPKALVPVLGVPMLDVVLNRLQAVGVETRGDQSASSGREDPRAPERTARDLEIVCSRRKRRSWKPAAASSRRCPCWATSRSLPSMPRSSGSTARSMRWYAWRPDGMMRAWMRCCCCSRRSSAVGYDGTGRFHHGPGRPASAAAGAGQVAPFLYAGIQICHPRLFRDAPQGAFSTNVVWDRAIEEDRLFGLRHDGEWYHVSTPQHLPDVERHLSFHGIRF